MKIEMALDRKKVPHPRCRVIKILCKDEWERSYLYFHLYELLVEYKVLPDSSFSRGAMRMFSTHLLVNCKYLS